MVAFTPVELGGFGYTEAQIGLRLTIRSTLFVISMCVAAPIQHYFGSLRTYQLALSFLPVTMAMLPIMSAFIKDSTSPFADIVYEAASAIFFLSWSLSSLLWRRSICPLNDLGSPRNPPLTASSEMVTIEAAPSPEYLATVYVRDFQK